MPCSGGSAASVRNEVSKIRSVPASLKPADRVKLMPGQRPGARRGEHDRGGGSTRKTNRCGAANGCRNHPAAAEANIPIRCGSTPGAFASTSAAGQRLGRRAKSEPARIASGRCEVIAAVGSGERPGRPTSDSRLPRPAPCTSTKPGTARAPFDSAGCRIHAARSVLPSTVISTEVCRTLWTSGSSAGGVGRGSSWALNAC